MLSNNLQIIGVLKERYIYPKYTLMVLYKKN